MEWILNGMIATGKDHKKLTRQEWDSHGLTKIVVAYQRSTWVGDILGFGLDWIRVWWLCHLCIISWIRKSSKERYLTVKHLIDCIILDLLMFRTRPVYACSPEGSIFNYSALTDCLFVCLPVFAYTLIAILSIRWLCCGFCLKETKTGLLKP